MNLEELHQRMQSREASRVNFARYANFFRLNPGILDVLDKTKGDIDELLNQAKESHHEELLKRTTPELITAYREAATNLDPVFEDDQNIVYGELVRRRSEYFEAPIPAEMLEVIRSAKKPEQLWKFLRMYFEPNAAVSPDYIEICLRLGEGLPSDIAGFLRRSAVLALEHSGLPPDRAELPERLAAAAAYPENVTPEATREMTHAIAKLLLSQTSTITQANTVIRGLPHNSPIINNAIDQLCIGLIDGNPRLNQPSDLIQEYKAVDRFMLTSEMRFRYKRAIIHYIKDVITGMTYASLTAQYPELVHDNDLPKILPRATERAKDDFRSMGVIEAEDSQAH